MGVGPHGQRPPFHKSAKPSLDDARMSETSLCGKEEFPTNIIRKMKKNDIINEILGYIGNNTSNEYKKWYVGITNDTERRVFGNNEHNVNKSSDAWICCPADSKEDAKEIESFFLAQGMDGDTGGGNSDTTIVYCYKKNNHTNP